ncbi:ADP-glyceromanno-heptose 6-epimerase [Bacteroidetes/Chlorobi group bacterium ChocPot_Mid]|jgi:ADP-L-glycero-D-manno-heptose 6-epimerase|nr:MAG: ADP-glyceromanno-heptose 6-epimerase [Bacteroidetes/Chlorobi group bacterium ChocPot_Mid]
MIVLTGGAGFIGSCFLKKLNDEGISEIIVVDRLGEGEKWKNLVGKKFARFVHKDNFLEMLFESGIEETLEAIVHLGACSTTTERDADYVFENNLNYSVELATYAAENDIRFIYASSAATYGDGSNGYSEGNYDELKPMNVYGLSKHLFDRWVIDHSLEKTFTGLKFFNVYGPNEYHKGEMASMIYKSFLQIENLGKVRLFKSNSQDYGDGEQKRDFIYVKDTVEVLWKILTNDKFSGIYNLGTGKARTWNDLVNAVFRALRKQPKIEYIEMPDDLSGQYQNFTQADMKKLNRSKVKIEFTTLEEGIDDYVKKFLKKEWKYY